MTERTEKLERALEALLTRVGEQQNVETAYAMEEASEEEMFTATGATYGAATRARSLLSEPTPQEGVEPEA